MKMKKTLHSELDQLVSLEKTILGDTAEITIDQESMLYTLRDFFAAVRDHDFDYTKKMEANRAFDRCALLLRLADDQWNGKVAF